MRWSIYLVYTLPMSNVWHKIICKRFSWKNKGIFDWYLSKLLKICLLSQPLGYFYKYTTKGVICIVVHHMLRLWAIISSSKCFNLFFQMMNDIDELLFHCCAKSHDILAFVLSDHHYHGITNNNSSLRKSK